MVGFILVTHETVGNVLLATVEGILKEKVAMTCISVKTSDDYQKIARNLAEALEPFKDSGAIILTDLFGATPSNLCKEFLKNGKVEMITGCNLPMVLKAATTHFQQSPAQVAQFLKNYGKENIRVYSTDY